MKKLFLKYLFEFFVLVFGITLSFYLQEYGEDLNSIQKQKEGPHSMNSTVGGPP